MEIFFEIHQGLTREGPGSNEATRLVFKMIPEIINSPKILDIGCGPGMQTTTLAKECPDSKIVAIDNHQPFLDQLQNTLTENNLSDQVELINDSMFELKFNKKSFDLIWSEGAIYIMGFKNGLDNWKKLLKDKGYLVVSEISWLRNEIPDGPLKFWQEAYPQMNTIPENIKLISESGYNIRGIYTLPPSGWWEDYYNPIEKRINLLKDKYASNKESLEILNGELKEIELYRKYHEYYSYVFYIMQIDNTNL